MTSLPKALNPFYFSSGFFIYTNSKLTPFVFCIDFFITFAIINFKIEIK